MTHLIHHPSEKEPRGLATGEVLGQEVPAPRLPSSIPLDYCKVTVTAQRRLYFYPRT